MMGGAQIKEGKETTTSKSGSRLDSPLVAHVDVARLLVQEAELGLFQSRFRVVGLLLAFRLAANPRHGWLSAVVVASREQAGRFRAKQVFFSITVRAFSPVSGVLRGRRKASERREIEKDRR